LHSALTELLDRDSDNYFSQQTIARLLLGALSPHTTSPNAALNRFSIAYHRPAFVSRLTRQITNNKQLHRELYDIISQWNRDKIIGADAEFTYIEPNERKRWDAFWTAQPRKAEKEFRRHLAAQLHYLPKINVTTKMKLDGVYMAVLTISTSNGIAYAIHPSAFIEPGTLYTLDSRLRTLFCEDNAAFIEQGRHIIWSQNAADILRFRDCFGEKLSATNTDVSKMFGLFDVTPQPMNPEEGPGMKAMDLLLTGCVDTTNKDYNKGKIDLADVHAYLKQKICPDDPHEVAAVTVGNTTVRELKIQPPLERYSHAYRPETNRPARMIDPNTGNALGIIQYNARDAQAALDIFILLCIIDPRLHDVQYGKTIRQAREQVNPRSNLPDLYFSRVQNHYQ
jgi:hypothetical protein